MNGIVSAEYKLFRCIQQISSRKNKDEKSARRTACESSGTEERWWRPGVEFDINSNIGLSANDMKALNQEERKNPQKELLRDLRGDSANILLEA